MLRLLKQFRWPLAAGLATLLTLAYLLQPRPMAEYRLNDSVKSLVGFRDGIKISPSGDYLLVFEGWEFRLLRLDGMQLIFKHRCIGTKACGFDADDGLAFAAFGGSKVECWHWKPGQFLPEKLTSRNTLQIAGLCTFAGDAIRCLLSPDARTWLISSRNEKTFHFDLVDAQTGQVRAQLDRPDIDAEKEYTTKLEIDFSPDSKRLLALPYETPTSQGHHALECFDVQTGKKLPICELPVNAKLKHLCQWDIDSLVGLKVNKNMLSMQKLFKDKGYQDSPLRETLPVPEEVAFPPGSDILWTAHIESRSFQSHASHGQVVYCWEHVLYPKDGDLSGLPHYLPGFHYAIRDLNTGALLHTEKLTNPLDENNFKRAGWNLLAILPDHVLVFQQPYEKLQPWQETLETWRRNYTNWLPRFFGSDHTRLQLIEAATGSRLATLSIPGGWYPTASAHKQQNALYLSIIDGDYPILQKYPYPLHKPWFIILSWALAIFATLACLQWLTQKLRCRRPV